MKVEHLIKGNRGLTVRVTCLASVNVNTFYYIEEVPYNISNSQLEFLVKRSFPHHHYTNFQSKQPFSQWLVHVVDMWLYFEPWDGEVDNCTDVTWMQMLDSVSHLLSKHDFED